MYFSQDRKINLNKNECLIFQKNGLKDTQSEPTLVSTETFDNATAFFPTSRPPPKWMLPQPSLPISQPGLYF